MIIKGGARAKPNELSTHLLRADTNEKVRLFDLSGVAAPDLRGALAEMNAIAAGSRATKPLYHVSISPGLTTILTDEQWRQTISTLEQALGLEGHQRAVVLHTKKDRQHAHIVWNRVDAETLKAAHHGHNFRTHEAVARQLEREFGLDAVQGVHIDRDGPRPKRRPSSRESQQEGRTGWSRDRAARDITDAWQQSETGGGFVVALERAGYLLVRGERKDAVILDPNGGIHGIARRIDGARIADVRERLADLDLTRFSSIKEGRDQLAARRTATRPPERLPDNSPAPAQYASLNPSHAATSPTHVATPPAQLPKPPEPEPRLRLETPKSPPVVHPSLPPLPPRPSANRAAAPDLTVRHDTERVVLKRRQEQSAAQENAELSRFHQGQIANLLHHHENRQVELVQEVEREIIQHNGLASRLRGLADRGRYNQRIAYLVAKRENILRRERERQERVKAELLAAQAAEKDAAAKKRAAREELELRALEQRHIVETHRATRSTDRDGRDGPG